jgi:hypothetical protein
MFHDVTSSYKFASTFLSFMLMVTMTMNLAGNLTACKFSTLIPGETSHNCTSQSTRKK